MITKEALDVWKRFFDESRKANNWQGAAHAFNGLYRLANTAAEKQRREFDEFIARCEAAKGSKVSW